MGFCALLGTLLGFCLRCCAYELYFVHEYIDGHHLCVVLFTVEYAEGWHTSDKDLLAFNKVLKYFRFAVEVAAEPLRNFLVVYFAVVADVERIKSSSIVINLAYVCAKVTDDFNLYHKCEF